MLVLSREDVQRLLDLDALIDRLAGAFVELSAGRASVPPRVASVVPERGLLAAMPGYVSGTLETKLVSLFPANEGSGVPTHQALIAVFDPDTGSPTALLDGTYITAMRTAAASALATRLLAREDARVLAVLGAGVQARSHLAALPLVRTFDEVRLASRTAEHGRDLAAEVGATPVRSFEDAVRGADVVCACTHSSQPVLRREWLGAGTHVTSVGASQEGPELDRETVSAGVLAVESRVAFEPPPAGAVELQGLDPDAAVELGELVAGSREGRTADDEITVYKSMGHAVEDAAAAALVLEAAVAHGAGTMVEL
jgi:ornithine cyclodeaminase/alanine dehydrogenase-like protein (mu-crystallin family)